MEMKDWAKREIEIACKHENPNRKEGEFDYGCACYESALKAFNSLMEDDRSGFSIGLTKQILNRLIDGKPLVPIEDTDDVWDDVWNEVRWSSDDKTTHYQCKRMSSLFKDVYSDGTIKYTDNNRVIGVNLDNPNVGWHSRITRDIVEELFPLTMPYMPSDKPYKVFCEDCLTDPKNGDFDTLAVYYILKPDGEKVTVNRYFKDGSTVYGGWDEICLKEYKERKEMDRKRREA